MMLQSRLLKGKVVLITGCNRGIGKSMVERFAEEGATIYACARQEGSLDILAADMSKKYSTIISQNYFDVNDKNGVKKVFTKIFKEQNRLDSIINNAGIMQDALLGMVSESLLAGLFSTNVFSVIGFIQYASKIMKRNNGGSIVNISSVVGTRGNAGQIAYSATKGAIVSITKTAAKELAQYNIRVNAIAPGMIDTDLLSNIDPNVKEKLKNSIRMGRIGKPEDISNVAVFLASDLSEYLTGQILEVDGSWEM